MELDPRKSRILTCVVESYIRTGEPIGSKMIAAMLEETVSSATVRNDLAYLSEQGYIEQPHTSAGRVPSPAGYRLLRRTHPHSPRFALLPRSPDEAAAAGGRRPRRD